MWVFYGNIYFEEKVLCVALLGGARALPYLSNIPSIEYKESTV